MMGIFISKVFLDVPTSAGVKISKRLHPLDLTNLTSDVANDTNPNDASSIMNSSAVSGENVQQPLLIGVFASNETMRKNINDTWGAHAPNLIFFSNGTDTEDILLMYGNNTCPSHKTVLCMFKYMYDQYIHKFNWFMWAHDESYVRVDQLVKVLSLLNASEHLYLGKPTVEMMNNDTGLRPSKIKHCSLGNSGVILSRSLLIKLGLDLEKCLQNLTLPLRVDLAVGRCITRRLRIQCMWNREVYS